MVTRALVLGGGGPVGVAWETGLIAGLDQEGVRLAEADLIIGTSAGSIVGAMLALGRSPQELLETQRTLQERDRPEQRPLQRPFDLNALLAQFAKIYTSDVPLQQVRAELGAFALAAETMSEDQWLATFGTLNQIAPGTWPERPFVCTAIDTADGALVVWDRDAGVDLVRAVASSCAVPGVFPPVTINGRRYMDGGVGSATNATLAQGYDRVLVVAVTAGGAQTAARPPAIAEAARQRFEAELDALRQSGAAVEVVVPDDASRQAFGPNLLDPSRRKEIAEAGVRQGRAEAERVRAFWG